MFDSSLIFPLIQVFMINVMMSADNALVIGMVAARVEESRRRKVIMGGLLAAVGLRIVFSVIALQLLQVIGLTLAGGILLLWVSWRLYRDIRASKEERAGLEAFKAGTERKDSPEAHRPASGQVITLSRAILQITIADLSMSVDNVLAVAGASNENWVVMTIGLVLSIAFMGFAATYIAKLLEHYPWLAYLGLVLILYVAGEMVWKGGFQVMGAF